MPRLGFGPIDDYRIPDGEFLKTDHVPDIRAPEHDLIAAVLHVGIVDALSCRTFHRDNVTVWERQAILWIQDTGQEPFSFEWCCMHLDLDPMLIRRVIRDGRKINTRTLKRWNTHPG